MYNTISGNLLLKKNVSSKSIRKIVISTDDRFLFVISDDGRAYLYDLSSLTRQTV